MDETSTSARQLQEAALLILMCNSIMGCNRASYYEILGVERTALLLDINKAYRKIAKAVHPDKNQCSDAEDAFKRVGKAYEVLSDETQRRLYDQGSLNNNYTEQHEDDANREEEFKRWDDLFRRAYQDYQQRENASRQENFDWSERWEYGSRNQQITDVIWTILRILFIFGVIYSAVFIALFFAPGPEYSLKSNEIFIVPRTTNRLSIKYYVTRKFIKIPAHIRASVDEPVEQEYLTNLQEKCDTEDNRKNNSSPTWIFCTPKGTCGTRDDMKTPSCDEMKKHNEVLFKHKRRKFA